MNIKEEIESRSPGELITEISIAEFDYLIRKLVDKDLDLSSLVSREIESKKERVEAKKLFCLANVVTECSDKFQILLFKRWKRLFFRKCADGQVLVEYLRKSCDCLTDFEMLHYMSDTIITSTQEEHNER
jgi:hypothetical protein